MSFKKLNKCVQNATQNCLAQNLTSSGLHNDVKADQNDVFCLFAHLHGHWV